MGRNQDVMYLFVFIFHFKLSTLSNQSENHPHDRSFKSEVKHAKMYMWGRKQAMLLCLLPVAILFLCAKMLFLLKRFLQILFRFVIFVEFFRHKHYTVLTTYNDLLLILIINYLIIHIKEALKYKECVSLRQKL